MSGRVDPATSNAGQIVFDDVDGETFDASVKPQAKAEPNVEAWKGKPLFAATANYEPQDATPHVDLAAQAAREAKELHKDRNAIATLQQPLIALAKQGSDFTSNALGLNLSGTLTSPEFRAATRHLSENEIRSTVGEQVKKAWPDLTGPQQSKLTEKVMGTVKEACLGDTARELQTFVADKMKRTADDFLAVLEKPKGLQDFAERLNDMGHPLAPLEDQTRVRDVREGLGLDPAQTDVSQETLKRALLERAALLKDQSKKMRDTDVGALYRTLVEQDVGHLYREAKGVRDGSLVDSQIEEVKQTGEKQARTLSLVRFASTVIAGSTFGVTAGLAFAAPKIMHSWTNLDTAAASEAAGTMKAGAAKEAQTGAVLETAEAPLAAGLGSSVGHGASAIKRVVTHAAVEGAVVLSAHALDASLQNSERAEGKNALERLE